MPNRVIKESIKRSPQIDALTWFEEVVFYRLIVTADDYGCIDGRPVLIKNELFPTRENVTRKSVEDAITKLVAVGLLYQYEVDGKPYLAFPTWEKHQRIRNKHRKYPAPPDSIHLSANCCQTPASCQPESESESNPNPNPNPSDSARRFTPPTVEQVAAYVRERRSPVDPQEFVDFYASKGWMVGKTPMKDWKAACRNAEKWDRWNKAQPQQHPSAPPDPKALERVRKLYGKVSGNGP